MTKPQKRQRHSAEFKQEIIKLVTESGVPITEAARRHQLNSNMVGRWVRAAREPVQSQDADVEAIKAENTKLKQQLKQLQQEREILVKAAAFFAKESI